MLSAKEELSPLVLRCVPSRFMHCTVPFRLPLIASKTFCLIIGLNNCACGKTNLDHDDVVWHFSEFFPIDIVNGGSYRVTEPALSGCLIRFTCIFSLNLYFYHPPDKLREGHVFSPVCLSVHGAGVPMRLLPMMHWASLYKAPPHPHRTRDMFEYL